MSRIVSCHAARPDNHVIDEIIETLEQGAAVVMPTETQYALSMRADRADTPEKIGRIKRRAAVIRAALFVKDIKMAEQFCRVSKTAVRLAERFLPGPLTLVMPGKENQTAVAAGFLSEHGFGIRISSSPTIAAVMAKASFAVTATSANISGVMTPATVAEIAGELGERVALYVDGGPCRGVVPSTVVKVNDDMEILRHGIIGEAEIRHYLEEQN